MRILIAPDKFKGTLTAPQAASAMAEGVRDALPQAEVDLCPLSDGGEGFVEAMTAARSDAKLVSLHVVGPLPELHVEASFAVMGDLAIIEMSAAAGLVLTSPELRNPLATTTFGVGQMLRHAAELGCRRAILGIGGSATCDAGIGCLQGCGCHVVLRDGQYADETEPLCGRDMDQVLLIKHGRGSPVDSLAITVACDVTNPLSGEAGSAHIYGPQKGASPADVLELDRMLRELAERWGMSDLARQPGMGAAGGIGFGLAAVLGATLQPGSDLVLDAVDFDRRFAAADLVLTGEGCFDATSLSGKITGQVLQRAGRKGRLIAGQIDADPATPCVSLSDTDPPRALSHAAEVLRAATCALIRPSVSQ